MLIGKILASVLTIVVTVILIGVGTYAYLTTPKIHIDNTSPLESTEYRVPSSHTSNNPSDSRSFNNTRMPSLSMENQYENNITISR